MYSYGVVYRQLDLTLRSVSLFLIIHFYIHCQTGKLSTVPKLNNTLSYLLSDRQIFICDTLIVIGVSQEPPIRTSVIKDD